MADEPHNEEHHDEIHMPGPSIAPLIIGLGFTLTATGIVYQVNIFIGLSLLALGIGIWAFGKYE